MTSIASSSYNDYYLKQQHLTITTGPVNRITFTLTPTTQAIIEVAKKTFYFLPIVTRGIIGIVEISCFMYNKYKTSRASNKCVNFSINFLQRFWNSIFKINKCARNHKVIHGTFLIQSSIFGIIAILGKINLIKAARLISCCSIFSAISFILAKITSLTREIIRYRTARKNKNSNNEAAPQEARLTTICTRSAKIGIVTALCHISATIAALFGGPLALTITLGTLSAITTLMKLLFDLVYRH